MSRGRGALVLISSLFVFGCDQGPGEAQANDLLSLFVAAGFAPDDIELLSEDTAVVQGDMLMTRDAITAADESDFRHYRSPATIRRDIEEIQVRLSVAAGTLPGMNDALNKALDAWNNIGGIQFAFSRTSCDTCDGVVEIQVGCPQPGYEDLFAWATLPNDAGEPGNRITVFWWPDDPLERASLLTHELGHSIGLRHTDWRDRSSCIEGEPEDEGLGGGAVHIPGSPEIDERSMMNACDSPIPITQFSEPDKAAIRAVYPG